MFTKIASVQNLEIQANEDRTKARVVNTDLNVIIREFDNPADAVAFARGYNAPTATEREQRMYGCTVAEMREAIGGSITMKFSGPSMCAASLMSDAQEEMARGMIEEARKTLNRAKWTLAEYADWKAEKALATEKAVSSELARRIVAKDQKR